MKKSLSFKIILLLSVLILAIGCLSGVAFASDIELTYLDISSYIGKEIKAIYFPINNSLDTTVLGRNVKIDEYGDYIQAFNFELNPDGHILEMRFYFDLNGVSLVSSDGSFNTETVFYSGSEDYIYFSFADIALNWGYDENAFVLNSCTSKMTEVLSSHVTAYIELFPSEFIVSFDVGDSETFIANQVVSYGEYATVPENPPVLDGYTFSHWLPEIETTPIIENTVFEAVYTINKYTVTFNTDGGTDVNSQEVTHGQFATVPDNPEKTGYYFNGWSPSIETTKITQDTTFTAQWIEKPAFDYIDLTQNFGRGVCSFVLDMEKLQEFHNSARTAVGSFVNLFYFIYVPPMSYGSYTWTFSTTDDGLQMNGDGGKNCLWSYADYHYIEIDVDETLPDYSFSMFGAEKLSLRYYDGFAEYAKNNKVVIMEWAERFTVTFDSAGGSPVASQIVEKGDKAVSPESPEKEGYYFGGWSPDISTTEITKDTTFVAQWSLQTFTVTFELNGGERIGGGELVQTVGYNQAAELPEVKKLGYFLSTWSGNYANVKSDITINAVWLEKYYTVTFKHVGGTYVSGQLKQQVQEGQAAVAPVIEWKGYTLSWDKSFDCVMSDMEINAVWTGIPVTVTADLNGGERVGGGDLVQIGFYGDNYNSPIVERDGYNFVGWSPSCSSFPLESVTIVAQWEIKTYYVHFHTGGGTDIDFQIVEHGKFATVPLNPVKEGYKFVGWSPSIETTVITEDTDFIAQWEIKKYTVVFITDGGSDIENQTVEHGSYVVLPDTPVKEGYTFVGWSPDITLPITDSVIFTAQWQINTYRVKFILYDNITYDEQIVEHGKDFVIPENPVRGGYTFVGWSPAIETIVVMQDMTFVAQWNEFHSVYFDSDGGNYNETQNVEHGKYATVPENPVKEGHTFIGWLPAIETTVITEDTTFVAQWKKNVYKVTFDLNGGVYNGDIDLIQYVEYGGRPDYPENPEKEGYVFKFWDNDTDYQITQDTTFVAQWERKIFAVAFDFGDDEPQIYKVAYGENVADLNIGQPVKDGFIFMGWSPDISQPVYSDMYFTPVWGKEVTFVVVSSGLSEYWQVPELVETVVMEYGKPLNYISSFEIPNSDFEFFCWCSYENLDVIFDDDLELGTYDEYFLTDYIVREEMTVYALYKQRLYTVTIDFNGGEWLGDVDGDRSIYDGQVFTYTGSEDIDYIVFRQFASAYYSGSKYFLTKFYRDGYCVTGWSYDLDYKPYGEDIVLSPIWAEGYYIKWELGDFGLDEYNLGIQKEYPYCLYTGALWGFPVGYEFSNSLISSLKKGLKAYDILGLGSILSPDYFAVKDSDGNYSEYDLLQPLNSDITIRPFSGAVDFIEDPVTSVGDFIGNAISSIKDFIDDVFGSDEWEILKWVLIGVAVLVALYLIVSIFRKK